MIILDMNNLYTVSLQPLSVFTVERSISQQSSANDPSNSVYVLSSRQTMSEQFPRRIRSLVEDKLCRGESQYIYLFSH